MTPENEAHVIALLERIVAALERDSAPKAAWIDADEFAALMGVDVRTLRRMRRAGGVPKPVQIGRNLRWKRVDVDRFLHARPT